MKQGQVTEIVFILDRSGSMAGLESDTIGGFNSLLDKQKKEPGDAILSTVLFDDQCEVIHDRQPIRTIRHITQEEYYVRGCTALLDAIGGAIQHIRRIHKHLKPEKRPDKTLLIITTDGMENSSRRFSYPQIKRMVEHQKEKHGWEFLFLGANIDAIATAKNFGIHSSRAVNYHSDPTGTQLNYQVLGQTISCLRESQPLSPSWKEEIELDYKKRKANTR